MGGEKGQSAPEYGPGQYPASGICLPGSYLAAGIWPVSGGYIAPGRLPLFVPPDSIWLPVFVSWTDISLAFFGSDSNHSSLTSTIFLMLVCPGNIAT